MQRASKTPQMSGGGLTGEYKKKMRRVIQTCVKFGIGSLKCRFVPFCGSRGKAMAAMESPIVAMDAAENAYGSVLQLVEPRARILSVSDCQLDHAALGRMVDAKEWQLTTAGNCQDAEVSLSRLGALVVFTDSVLPDGTWKDLLAMISSLDEPPLLVVTSRLADEHLWSEVLNLGGYDVLVKPFVEREVKHVLASVWAQNTHRRTHILPLAS